jgi:hypothetical protein
VSSCESNQNSETAKKLPKQKAVIKTRVRGRGRVTSAVYSFHAVVKVLKARKRPLNCREITMLIRTTISSPRPKRIVFDPRLCTAKGV